jgi:hypothetical protein
MKNIFFAIMSMLLSISASATQLRDYTPYEYDVRFTNPICKEYFYQAPVQSRAGETLVTKPRNAYCTLSDAATSQVQELAPMTKLLEWIRDPNTNEIFFTFLSYSSEIVTDELCKAIQERDVKVTFVLDRGAILDTANRLVACQAKTPSRNPRMIIRGGTGGIGFAHNKFFIMNPADAAKMRIVFGSGNMTSGIVLHHENWHFVTTSPKSYFAQAHLCLMKAEIEHADSRETFSEFMQECLSDISATPEDDIKAFFVPMEGAGAAAMQNIIASLSWAKKVKLAAHRFSNKDLIAGLKAGLLANQFNVELVFDDDIFWAGTAGAKRPNTAHEFKNVLTLTRVGAQSRYVQTNEQDHLLHHNKFIVFEGDEKSAAFVGAGNFTGDAFEKNLENFYYVTVPEIVAKMSAQYDHLYNDLATAEKDLPVVETPVITSKKRR